MRRRVTILGSTGSVGSNTVSLLKELGGIEVFDVIALTGSSNIGLLASQARALDANIAVTADASRLGDLKAALGDCRTEAMAGPEALLVAASEHADWTMSSIVGAAGLAPGLQSARHGGVVALANKESLVCAGELFRNTCQAHGTRLVPADSEHSAIHQALTGEDIRTVDRVIITASGGPFRTYSLQEMQDVTPAQARRHPNWSMGERISIDSATMFNKALEVIEANVLFDLTPEQIEVVIHPQSIIHSMVGFSDGAIMAHLGPPDMRGAIGYALNWPERQPLPLERLNFETLGSLDFLAVDHEKFPALNLASRVMENGGLSGAVFNASKEIALDGFISGFIGFLDMSRLVEHVHNLLATEASAVRPGYSLDDVMNIDALARHRSLEWLKQNGRN